MSSEGLTDGGDGWGVALEGGVGEVWLSLWTPQRVKAGTCQPRDGETTSWAPHELYDPSFPTWGEAVLECATLPRLTPFFSFFSFYLVLVFCTSLLSKNKQSQNPNAIPCGVLPSEAAGPMWLVWILAMALSSSLHQPS